LTISPWWFSPECGLFTFDDVGKWTICPFCEYDEKYAEEIPSSDALETFSATEKRWRLRVRWSLFSDRLLGDEKF